MYYLNGPLGQNTSLSQMVAMEKGTVAFFAIKADPADVPWRFLI